MTARNREMAIAYLVHGFIGAGKTGISKQISEATGAIRISPDEWYIQLFGTDGQVGISTEAESRMRSFLRSHWPQLITAGLDIVLDFGFWTRAERDDARHLAHEAGGETILFELVTDRQEALDRCRIRNARPDNSFFISEQIYDTLIARFEPLTFDEKRVTIAT